MSRTVSKSAARSRRQARIRSTVQGTAVRPRLAVFRSLKSITAQLIDDTAGKTLISATRHELKGKGTKVDQAKAVGKLIAEKAMAKKITSVVFDRAGYRYHGRVQALAEGAREGGLQF